MVTRKVFWDDPYRTEISARVTGVEGDVVTLDGTIFFAFAGGQERDHGTIGGRTVEDARWEGPDIIYRLDSGHGLAVGDDVIVAIDPERRDRLRRLHMATEIVLELLTQRHPELQKIGAHMSPERGRIDFAADTPLTARLAEPEEEANRMIEANLIIVRDFYPESTKRRFWRIDDFAEVPCGGTLPARTGEIGPVALRRKNPGRGKERVEIELLD